MIRSTVVSPFQANCWVVVCPTTAEAAVIDPGGDLADILELLKDVSHELKKPLQVRTLLHTHAHLDHMGATRELYQALAPAANGGAHPAIALHPADGELWTQLASQGRMFGLQYDEPLPVTTALNDGDELSIGQLGIRVLHTPGHSPGGVCLYLRSEKTVFTGDTLFQGSVGRTDLWGGSHPQLIASIRRKLWSLPDDTRVCSGHGPDTRIAVEKLTNPFMQGAAQEGSDLL